MGRKISKEAYDYVISTIEANGSMPTGDVVELIRPHYDFDPAVARERELRRYVGQIVRGRRDEHGTRTMFLEKGKSEIVDLDHCADATKITAIASQLKMQAVGAYRSYRKAAMRKAETEGQVSFFDEVSLWRELRGDRPA